MMQNEINIVRKNENNAWRFYGITFLYTWIFWIILLISGFSYLSVKGLIIYGLGGIAPTLWAIIFIFRRESKEYRVEFKDRLFNVKRMGWKYAGLILAFNFGISLISFFLSAAMQESPLSWDHLKSFFANPGLWLFSFFFAILAVSVEEPGWRGYALDKLRLHFDMRTVALITSGLWALWHLPMFFINDTYQQSLNFGSIAFFCWVVQILAQGVLIAWLMGFNKNSILNGIIFHFATNFFGEMFDLSLIGEIIRTILYLIPALLIIALDFFPTREKIIRIS